MEEMITITKKEYDKLIEQIEWLRALEAAGVDNWEGYDHAKDIIEEYK
jgi:hypothetical protein